jgi:hypothetical protein
MSKTAGLKNPWLVVILSDEMGKSVFVSVIGIFVIENLFRASSFEFRI